MIKKIIALNLLVVLSLFVYYYFFYNGVFFGKFLSFNDDDYIENLKEARFLQFKIYIPKDWEKRNDFILDDIQFFNKLNKKIKFYYSSKDKEQNLIVVYSELKESYEINDINDIINAIIVKLRSFKGYRLLGDIYKLNLNCKFKNIDLYIHKFSIGDVYYLQTYIFYDDIFLIISFFSKNIKDLDKFIKYLKTLDCI